MITWEPWVTEFDGDVRTQLRPLPQRETRCLEDIASGEYNFYARAWADAARDYGRPFFLRFGHEMNNAYRYPWGPQNGNTPASFIRAWRQLHETFRAAGASNAIWVWAPHIGRDDFPEYYPGDDVVDWVGTGVLNYGTAMPWSRWWSFDELLGPHYGALASSGKPIMIAELGTVANGGARDAWYRDTFAAVERYPAIRAVVLFHQAADATISAAPLSWGILDSPAAIEAVKNGLSSAAYNPRSVSSH
jgi:beta-mannanase